MSNDHPRISLNEAKLLIKNQWRARETKQKPIFLEGARGVGKTQSVAQLAKELSEESGLDVQSKTVIVSVMEAPDLNGMPYIKNGVTEYGRPHFLPSEGHGILFLDEGNRANKDIQNGLLTLIEDRSINGHKLGDGWTIVLAGNPVTTGNGTGAKYNTNAFDDALKDRLSFYTMDTKVQEVVAYLRNRYSSTNPVVSWITLEPQMVCLDGTKPTSPRSLEYLINAFKVQKGVENFTIAAGVIGSDAGHAFCEFLKNPHTLTIKHLFNITDEVKQVILNTQEDLEGLATLNYWTEIFAAELQRLANEKAPKAPKGEKGAKTEEAKNMTLDFVKMKDLKEKTANFLVLVKNAEWIDSFVRKLSEMMDQDEDSIKKQFAALHATCAEQFKANYKESAAKQAAKIDA